MQATKPVANDTLLEVVAPVARERNVCRSVTSQQQGSAGGHGGWLAKQSAPTGQTHVFVVFVASRAAVPFHLLSLSRPQAFICEVQVFADVAKRYLHEVAAVRQQGSASTSGFLSNRVNQAQRRSQSFFRDEVPQDPVGQVKRSTGTLRRWVLVLTVAYAG